MKYKVSKNLKKPFIITEIKRPDPEAVLVLRPDAVVEVSEEEMELLQTLIPAGVLTEVVEKAKPPVEKPPVEKKA